jgi:hypothetical protein
VLLLLLLITTQQSSYVEIKIFPNFEWVSLISRLTLHLLFAMPTTSFILLAFLPNKVKIPFWIGIYILKVSVCSTFLSLGPFELPSNFHPLPMLKVQGNMLKSTLTLTKMYLDAELNRSPGTDRWSRHFFIWGENNQRICWIYSNILPSLAGYSVYWELTFSLFEVINLIDVDNLPGKFIQVDWKCVPLFTNFYCFPHLNCLFLLTGLNWIGWTLHSVENDIS